MDVTQHLTSRMRELHPEGGKLLAAVSGGGDSVALLHALVDSGFEVAAAHLDHGLRGDSAEDARFVANLCRTLGVDLYSERSEVAEVARSRGLNLEDAARRVRYSFLTRAARRAGATAIATGHTLDDQVETVLLQILRGAAYPRGMRARSRRVIRPMLDLPRTAVRAWLVDEGIDWREDSSNEDIGRRRAWLRNELLPRLEDRLPSAAGAMARLASIQQDVEDFLRGEAQRLARGSGFDRLELAAAHPALQREALRWLLSRADATVSYDRLEEVRSRLGQKTPYRISLRPGLYLRVAYDRVELARAGGTVDERGVSSAAELPRGVSVDALDLPELRFRSRLPGDVIRLSAGTKKLSKVLIDRKIPREDREALEVLASGNRVVWAEGVGPSVDFRVRGDENSWDERAKETEDARFMGAALEQARAAVGRGELPVGAVVVRGGQIIGSGHNLTESTSDPTGHAELVAMREASRSLGDWRLTGCTLYVTLEPCPMCAGAALESHLARIVYGAANRRDGALGSVHDLYGGSWKRQVDVTGGVLASPAARLLSDFFRERRDDS